MGKLVVYVLLFGVLNGLIAALARTIAEEKFGVSPYKSFGYITVPFLLIFSIIFVFIIVAYCDFKIPSF
jgi:hypothetical protein